MVRCPGYSFPNVRFWLTVFVQVCVLGHHEPVYKPRFLKSLCNKCQKSEYLLVFVTIRFVGVIAGSSPAFKVAKSGRISKKHTRQNQNPVVGSSRKQQTPSIADETDEIFCMMTRRVGPKGTAGTRFECTSLQRPCRGLQLGQDPV